MTDTGIYCTGSDVVWKAGSGCSAAIKTGSIYTNSFISQAEGVINVACGKEFASSTTAFQTLGSGMRTMLTDAASNMAAIYAINWDYSGYPTRIVAEDSINVLRDAYLRDLAILKERESQSFLMTGVAP